MFLNSILPSPFFHPSPSESTLRRTFSLLGSFKTMFMLSVLFLLQPFVSAAGRFFSPAHDNYSVLTH